MNTTPNMQSDHARQESIAARPSAPALWASAFVLLALVITQAGRITGGGASAIAGNVAQVNDLTVLTAEASDGQDNLILLDRRSERIFVYGIVQQQQNVQLIESYDMKEVFRNARNQMGGAGQRP